MSLLRPLADKVIVKLIDENEVTAGHAASVGRVDPEEMYYLLSRGLHKEEAERLVREHPETYYLPQQFENPANPEIPFASNL